MYMYVCYEIMNNICLWFEMSKLLAKYKYTYTCVTYLRTFFVHVSQSLTSNHVIIVTITCAPVFNTCNICTKHMR